MATCSRTKGPLPSLDSSSIGYEETPRVERRRYVLGVLALKLMYCSHRNNYKIYYQFDFSGYNLK